ncbi:relaxase domain-containing protein [Streptomyces sp. NBC_00237]|uniref:MobF family relaxase n=1 Tax=Streptomyces sp. NBC_00237 TaxID=2975687 RepID=UPI0022580697|nr:MobF family relaxase [Streptomyces sp. NBC_00237]MCX5207624.1 relaxase domain-containing protein [Streptomyces sp. NBC_00237]
MLSIAKVQRRNAWRYYVRGVAYGDGRRPVGQALKDAQETAGLPPGVWRGRGLAALGLTDGARVTERQMELLFGRGQHPDADRIERRLLDDGVDPGTARRATVLGQPIEEIEARKQTPLLALDFTFRPQASLVVLWALGDERTRRVIERAHERAVAATLRWLEDEVAEIRWGSGRHRAKAPALVVAAYRHFDNRNGFPLLHEHCLIANRAQRPDGSWYALDTVRLYQHVVAAGTLYTLTMTTEVCEELGLATVPREVTPGLRPVMEIAGVDQELIAWSSTRRRRIEDVLEGITDDYIRKHGRLPGERARHGLAWWAAQETRPEKKTPRPLDQLLAWWRVCALLKFGQRVVDGLLERCRAAGAVIRARVGPRVDTALAAVDVAAVVFTVRNVFARRHVLAEARRHLLETLRGRALPPRIDSYIADRALECYGRQLTVPQKGQRAPAPDQLSYTCDFSWPVRWWIAGADGKPPRESSRYERARVASLALQNAIRAALTAPPAVRDGAPTATSKASRPVDDHHGHDDQTAPHAVDHPGRDAARTPAQHAATIHAHQQAAMPQEYLEGRTTDPATWMTSPQNLARIAAHTRAAEARSRQVEEKARGVEQAKQPEPSADPGSQQHHPTAQPDQSRGPGRAG